MTQSTDSAPNLVRTVAQLFSSLPQVEAVALGGSRVRDRNDSLSDIDLYVYTHAEIPLGERSAIVDRAGGASTTSLGLTQWGSSDQWFDAATGIELDIIYFDTDWMESQLHRVLHGHYPSSGYTTSFWYTIRYSHAFYDPHRWFQKLQVQSQQNYPEVLRRNIIAFNHPVLRNVIPAYTHQWAKAVQRHDLVAVNHYLTALLACYFDVLFALNRTLHPGVKRMVTLAQAWCPLVPVDMQTDIESVIHAAATADPHWLSKVTRLLDRLDDLLDQAGFDPQTSQPRIAT